MIYTSYLSNPVLKVNSDKYLVISIMRYTPSWFKGLICNEFAPSEHFVKLSKSDAIEDYRLQVLIGEYVSQLCNADVRDILDTITSSTNKDIVFCCCETPDKFCHRRIFSWYIQSQLGINVQELNNEV